jgi:hypothetical protein
MSASSAEGLSRELASAWGEVWPGISTLLAVPTLSAASVDLLCKTPIRGSERAAVVKRTLGLHYDPSASAAIAEALETAGYAVSRFAHGLSARLGERFLYASVEREAFLLDLPVEGEDPIEEAYEVLGRCPLGETIPLLRANEPRMLGLAHHVDQGLTGRLRFNLGRERGAYDRIQHWLASQGFREAPMVDDPEHYERQDVPDEFDVGPTLWRRDPLAAHANGGTWFCYLFLDEPPALSQSEAIP